MAVATVKIHDGRVMHLGRRPPDPNKVVLRLRDYLRITRTTQNPPTTIDFLSKATAAVSQVYLNDQLGCCVISGKAHSVGIWTGNESGTPVIATDAEIRTAYNFCGSGDNGCVITDVLDRMKANGLIFGGQVHTIAGYVAVDWTNPLELQSGIALFGAPTFGINLTQEWANDPATWGVVSGSDAQVVGGHDVPGGGYDVNGVTICTWGGTRKITWAAIGVKTWIEEAYCLLSPDWYAKNNLDPMGVDVVTLQADLAALGGGQVPPFPHQHPHHHHHPRRPPHPPDQDGGTETSSEGLLP